MNSEMDISQATSRAAPIARNLILVNRPVRQGDKMNRHRQCDYTLSQESRQATISKRSESRPRGILVPAFESRSLARQVSRGREQVARALTQ